MPPALPGFLALLALAAVPLAGQGLGSRAGAQLTVLHLADVYEMSPISGGKYGGLARAAALERRVAGERRHVIVTLGGDFLSPSVASSVFRGEQMIEALGAMGLDLATLGNHEFDFGPDVLRRRMREAPWDWVVSNVLDEATGKPFGGASPRLVREYGGLTLGFLGLCLAGEEITAGNREGVEFVDPFAAAERYLPELRAAGAELVIALTHLDYADDVRLARRFPEIGLILGGHEHFPIATHVERTLIVKPGSDARNVAQIDVSRPAADAPIERHFEMVPIVEGLVEDPVTAGVVAGWEARLDRELDVEVGATGEPLNAVAEEVRSGESNLGNLFADAMRRDTGAEIAILNAGSIRSNRVYPPGRLTRRDLLAMHPFGGLACEVEATGATVAAALENGFSRLGESSGRFPQVAGIEVEVDPARPAGQRLVAATVGGRPLEPERLYRVTITDYMLAGGDGYSMFEDARLLVGPEEAGMLVSLLEATVRERQPLEPRVEGRIRFVGEPAPVRAARRRPVLLDTDMGIDSVMGLLYLLKAPEVRVEAITIVHGIADVKPAAHNALRILELTGDGGTPYVGIDNTAAEWNFYLDPHAAERVLESGASIRLMPLDATRALPVTAEFVDRVRGRPRDQTSELLLSLLEAVREGIDAGWYYFWDVLAAVATARPEVLACRDETLEVVTRDGPQLGRTRPAVAGAAVCVVEQINRQAFEEHLLEAILD